MYGFVDRFARFFAILGGMVLTSLIILTCLSIIGRSINTILYGDLMQSAMPEVASALLATGVGSINGAFEIVEAGMAFVVFAFLPLCQLNGAHASVDLFSARLPRGINNILRVFIEIVFAGVIVVITWELFQGMLSKQRTGQTSFILQFPVWWPYAFSLVAAVAATIVAVYVGIMRLIEQITGRSTLPGELEAEH